MFNKRYFGLGLTCALLTLCRDPHSANSQALSTDVFQSGETLLSYSDNATSDNRKDVHLNVSLEDFFESESPPLTCDEHSDLDERIAALQQSIEKLQLALNKQILAVNVNGGYVDPTLVEPETLLGAQIYVTEDEIRKLKERLKYLQEAAKFAPNEFAQDIESYQRKILEAQKMLKSLQEQLAKLRVDSDEFRQKVKEGQEHVKQLLKQIEEMINTENILKGRLETLNRCKKKN